MKRFRTLLCPCNDVIVAGLRRTITVGLFLLPIASRLTATSAMHDGTNCSTKPKCATTSGKNLDYGQRRSLVRLHGETTKDEPGLICPKIQESPYPV
ncbi:unnamed protein product [Pleuronectes platessa]|uniref:Uncharacterized protein n=1 Tax=Pleuronectes platessa TaxID=8262 RepID=A0A9N7VG12_PLEPL|nr:unnamed protein product [Pleuronectes platessa]